MVKCRTIGVALALALMLCLTMLGSGAMAQNAHSTASANTTTTVATIAHHAATQLATTRQVNTQRLNPHRRRICYWRHLGRYWIRICCYWVHRYGRWIRVCHRVTPGID